MNKDDVANMTQEEILELLGGIDLEQLQRVRSGRASVLPAVSVEDEIIEDDELLYSDEEFEEITKARGCVLQADTTFTDVLNDTAFYHSLNDVEKETVLRWVDIEDLRLHYSEFEDFLYDCMVDLMGFQCSDIQVDIGKFLQYGPTLGMIQAQRSQAKSTIVAIFADAECFH